MPLAEEMAARGHEVVVLMPHPTKKPNPKVNEIIIDGHEFIELTEKLSEKELKAGADGIPPVFEMFNAGLLVSIEPLKHQSKAYSSLNVGRLQIVHRTMIMAMLKH